MQAQSPDVMPELSPRERSLWADLISQRCGLSFADSRAGVLARSLWQRTRERGMPSFTAYYHLLAHEGEQTEWSELFDLLTNNDTAFFRHPPSFDALTRHLLPRLVQDRSQSGERDVLVWSAGCSTGQEAYSLAACFLLCQEAIDWRFRVVGSDLSRKALARARLGRYRPFEMRGLEGARWGRFFRPVRHAGADYYEAADELKAVVSFAAGNLCEPRTWQLPAQDVVFCQNVLIYFRPADREPILRHLVDRLRPGGYLVLSPAESMGLTLPGTFRMPFDAAVYQRIP